MSCMEGAGCLSFFRMRNRTATVWIERFLLESMSAVRNSRSILSIFFFLFSLLSFSSIFSFFLSLYLSHTHSLTLTLSPSLSLCVCFCPSLSLSLTYTHSLSLSLFIPSSPTCPSVFRTSLNLQLQFEPSISLSRSQHYPHCSSLRSLSFPLLSSYLYPSEKSGSIVTASW